MYLSQNMECCAVGELVGLEHVRTPKKAMLEVCNGMRCREYDYLTNRYIYHEGMIIPGHIVFTGVVGYTNRKSKPTYGQRFKQLILKNKLGTVTESRVGRNHINHPTHIVKVWVWTPNVRALKAWWKKNGSAQG